jgi:hypothetical protein
MSKPDTPFPGHWGTYMVPNSAVIAAAIVLAPKWLGAF